MVLCCQFESRQGRAVGSYFLLLCPLATSLIAEGLTVACPPFDGILDLLRGRMQAATSHPLPWRQKTTLKFANCKNTFMLSPRLAQQRQQAKPAIGMQDL
jgi:hypothetical protein